ncbi:type II secretion system F family protein [Candidatus Microgenomates bacterium]|nr:MAG: type II secretion system F family protein [Candidatus Microgenomates bacterium]
MKLTYKAVDRGGKIIRGIIEAKDITEAAGHLRSKELLPISISSKYSDGMLGLSTLFNKFRSSDLVFFTRQLSSMLSSGLTLMQALNILKDQVQNPAVKDVVTDITSDIEGGKSLSGAISKYPDIFGPIYVSLIKAAETSGLLDKVLLRLSDNLEKEQKLKSAVKSALMYPAIVIIGMVIVVFIMMIFVIPQLSILYESLNVPMPMPTQIVIGISHFVVLFWPLIIGIGVISFIFYKRWSKTESGGLIVDEFKLKIPIFGKLSKQIILTEFTRTLGLLIGAGTLVVEALNQTSSIAGNRVYKNAILGSARRVEKGMTVGDSMMYSILFPPIVVQMARIGEQTGKLDESLLKVSEYYEREVDQTVKTLMTALEPIIMVVLGSGVAFLIISIITPIYNLTSAIK